MNQRDPTHIGRHGRRIAITIGFLLGAAVLVLWAWNTVAVDLFDAPHAQYKHALAALAGLLALASLMLSAPRLGGAGAPAKE
tara:strand:+ start:1446 stop:1691 length:246 start_codon:yes stop_codon:yes gene_type:complete